MRSIMRARTNLVAAAWLTAMAASAGAQEPKPWKHGPLEAKSDAGFIFMPAKGGFAEKQGLKLDVVQFKGDAIALKAMLAGELDTYEGSPGGPMFAGAGRRRHKNPRLLLADADLRNLCARRHRGPGRPAGQDLRDLRSRLAARSPGACRAGGEQAF